MAWFANSIGLHIKLARILLLVFKGLMTHTINHGFQKVFG